MEDKLLVKLVIFSIVYLFVGSELMSAMFPEGDITSQVQVVLGSLGVIIGGFLTYRAYRKSQKERK